MHHYPNQRTALEVAAQVLEALPAGTIFGITITDDDDHVSPSVFNIFAPASEWLYLRSLLNLNENEQIDRGERYISFRVGPMEISITEPEEDDDE